MNKIIKKYFLSVICFVFLSFGLFTYDNVLASDYTLQGKLYFPDNDVSEIALSTISVKTYKLGSDKVTKAEVKKDGRGQVSFSANLNDLNKNDQLIVVSQVEKESGLFGGLSTVITDKELTTGVIGGLTIYLSEIPVPVFEMTDDKDLKICWKGMDDFSVVGYEIMRSEIVDTAYESVGRSGQTAGRQVCFTDNTLDSGVKQYYRLGVLTSWSAGEGKEVMISDALSVPSNGMMLTKGVVENREVVKINASQQNDLTLAQVVDENSFDNIIDKYLVVVKNEIEKRGWSYQMVLLIAIALVLVVIIAFFVISVEFANIRSGGSGVWERKVSRSIFSDMESKSKDKKKKK